MCVFLELLPWGSWSRSLPWGSWHSISLPSSAGLECGASLGEPSSSGPAGSDRAAEGLVVREDAEEIPQEQHPRGTLGPCRAGGCLVSPLQNPAWIRVPGGKPPSLWEGVRVMLRAGPRARRGFMGHLGWQPFPLLGCRRVRISLWHRIPLACWFLGLCSHLSPLYRGRFPPSRLRRGSVHAGGAGVVVQGCCPGCCQPHGITVVL